MYVAKTDIGKKREKNEDYYMAEKLDETASVYILADGMGGYESGEVASKSCCLAVMDKIESVYYDLEIVNDKTIYNMIKDAIYDANKLIFNLEKTDEKYKGMGTTLIIVFIYDSVMYYASIGDSRIYVVDKDITKINRITEDDTYVNELLKKKAINAAEAKNHPQKHILTKAIGVFENIDYEIKKLDLNDLGYILLFSDGATNALRRKDMLDIFSTNEFESWADEIVKKANEFGGGDNITVIAIKVD